jgi:hypothetical protein
LRLLIGMPAKTVPGSLSKAGRYVSPTMLADVFAFDTISRIGSCRSSGE